MAEEQDIYATSGTVQLPVTKSSAVNLGSKDPTPVTLVMQQTTGSSPPARSRGATAASPSGNLPITQRKK
jgi:hypothetical protein